MMTEAFQVPLRSRRNVRIQSPLGEGALHLLSLSGNEELSRGFVFRVEVASVLGPLEFSDLLGKRLGITFLTEGESRHVHGIVTDIAQTGTDREPRYELVLQSALALLSLNCEYRVYQNQSVPDIVRQVFERQDELTFEMRLTQTYAPREYCVQYGESDLSFVARLLEDEGIFFSFEHEGENHKLVLCDSAEGSGEEPRELPYLPAGDPDRRQRDHVFEWSSQGQVRAGRHALGSYDFERPSASLHTELASGREGSAERQGTLRHHYDGTYRTREQGDLRVRLHMEEESARSVLVRGCARARFLGAGEAVHAGGSSAAGHKRRVSDHRRALRTHRQ